MEIVVLDKVLQIDNGVWFFILFSVHLRVVRSLELHLFNYYLQWYSDTRKFLAVYKSAWLGSLGKLYWMYGMERTLWLFLQKCVYQLSKSKKCLDTSGSPKNKSCFLQTLAQKPLHHEPLCHCSLPVLSSAELGHPDPQSCAGAFVSVATKSWLKASGELKGASDLAAGCPASLTKADSGNRKKGKHLALLVQYSIQIIMGLSLWFS